MDITKFKWGIEHEFPVLKGDVFCDFTNMDYETLSEIIEELPYHKQDYPDLRIGDIGVKKKRWYVEGFERFDEKGDYLYTVPKGMEIRTPVCNSIEEAVSTLRSDLELWKLHAKEKSLEAIYVSYNPFKSSFLPDPALNAWELSNRRTPEQQTDYIYMLTYGPDINFSHPDFTTSETIDIARKLTYYSPLHCPV